jgi:hypothetical protein
MSVLKVARTLLEQRPQNNWSGRLVSDQGTIHEHSDRILGDVIRARQFAGVQQIKICTNHFS